VSSSAPTSPALLALRERIDALDRELLAPRQWSAGLVLALTLAALQIATLPGPLRLLRRSALLDQEESAQPRLAWRWVSAPWLRVPPCAQARAGLRCAQE
jgi:hypothetical protein